MIDLFFGPSMPRRSDMGTEAVESRIRDVRVDDAMVRIVYSYHGARNIEEEIADGTNALVIESGAGALTRIIHEKISASTDPIDLHQIDRSLFFHSQYSELAEYAIKDTNRLPLYLIDMPILYSIRKKEGDAYQSEENNAGYSLLAAAVLLGASKLTNKVNRRNFLKGAGVSTLALAGSLGLPWFARQMAWLAENVGSTATTKLYDIAAHLQEDRGYMDFILGLRNLVIAHKIHTVIDVLKRDYGVAKPIVSSFYGAFHGRGLKETLEMPPEKRWKLIEELVELAKAGAAEDDKIDSPMPYIDHVFKVPELRRKESGEGWDTRMIEMQRPK